MGLWDSYCPKSSLPPAVSLKTEALQVSFRRKLLIYTSHALVWNRKENSSINLKDTPREPREFTLSTQWALSPLSPPCQSALVKSVGPGTGSCATHVVHPLPLLCLFSENREGPQSPAAPRCRKPTLASMPIWASALPQWLSNHCLRDPESCKMT